MPPRTLLIWDIDGTLLLTGGAGKIAFNRTFEELYRETDIWQDMVPDGRTDISLIKECYQKRFARLPGDGEIEKVKNLYVEYLRAELPRSERFRLMPHVTETLEKTTSKNQIVMGIATGNFKLAATHKLRHAGLDRYFHFGGYGCDAEDRLELTRAAIENGRRQAGGADVKKIFVIGDTVHDVRCGKALGAVTVAVATGSTPKSALEQAGATFVLNHLGELGQIDLAL